MSKKRVIFIVAVGCIAVAIIGIPCLLLQAKGQGTRYAKIVPGLQSENKEEKEQKTEEIQRDSLNRNNVTKEALIQIDYENSFVTELLSFEEQYGLRIAIRDYIARENISEVTKASSLWYETYDEEKKADIFYFVLDTPTPTVLHITHLKLEQEFLIEPSTYSFEEIQEKMQLASDSGDWEIEEETQTEVQGGEAVE